MTIDVIPPVIFPPKTNPPPIEVTPTPRTTLENTTTSASEQQMSLAALDSLLPIVYGTRPISPLIANVLTNQSDWIFWVIWCEGPIDQITTITMDDLALPASAVVTNYLGNDGQTADATLIAAFGVASPPVAFNESLPNVVYSVIKIPHADIAGPPRFAAVVNGRKVKTIEGALQYDVTISAGVNPYAYHRIMNDAYLIQAGDVLRYDYFVAAAAAPGAVGGFEIDLTGSPPNLRSSTCVDNDGQNIIAPLAKPEGVWIQRSIDLDDVAGQTTASFNLVLENDTPGSSRILYRNIRITNADGTEERKVIWTSGLPDQNSAAYYNLATASVSTSAEVFSRNPSLQAADYITNTVFGAGMEVDWASVSRCAFLNDIVIGTAPNTEYSRLSDIIIDSESSCDNWIDTWRAIANVFFSNNQGVIKFIPDKGGDPVAAYSHANGDIIGISNIELSSPQQLPTVIEIVYTDVSSLPWKDARQTFRRTGVLNGITPWRFSSVPMRWITRPGQALREANERGNKLWLRSMKFNIEIFDEGFQHEPGDIIEIDYPDAGFENLPVRISAVTPSQRGWILSVSKEDPNAYDYTSQASPGVGNVILPVPSNPPSLGTISAEEEIYQTQSGTWASRVRVTWTAPNFPFIDHYRIVVWEGSRQIFTGTAAAGYTSWTTSNLQELVDYQIDIQIVSVTGASGPISSDQLRVLGKFAAPGNVPNFRGFEAGGKVFLYWNPAVDLDIFRYEIRYGSTTGSWATASVFDRVDALNKVVEGLAAGTWNFYVAALDSVGNYSPVPSILPITITLDNNSFLLSNITYTTPVLTNMTDVTLLDGSHLYVTDFGNNIGYGHTNTDNTLGDFTLPSGIVYKSFITPRTSGTASTYQTNPWDLGITVSGNVTFAPIYNLDEGTVTVYVDTSLDGVSWTAFAGGSAKTTFRFIRGRIVSNTTDGAFSVVGYPTARVDVIPRTENFNNQLSLAAGPKRITLAGQYATAKAVLITPLGTLARTYAVDNVILGTGTNSFDVYIFNASGTQVANAFNCIFEGI